MSLIEIIALLALGLIGWLFWQTRSMAELAKKAVNEHCDKFSLQLLAIARITLKPSRNKRGNFCWRATYQFEFSSDGDSLYVGYLVINGDIIVKIDTPVYRQA
ncbi:MAG: DUF3301 domain-containing protein [Gammaproteobacteria bacterium]|nr:DUF3301 domain-containing protein [Gammaproteobacteria bacterium]